METITITSCPLCNMSHTYELEVERSIIIKMMTMDSKPDPERSVKFKRLFYCPNKNDDYQATLTLFETSSNSIRSVSVKGVKND